MIRLTVLYNLPAGTDETAFLEWRVTEHQKNNQSMPGVQRTSFARITNCWPDGANSSYRFQTLVEWPDRPTFEAGFYDPTVQAKLKQDLKLLGDYEFIVSDVLIESDA